MASEPTKEELLEQCAKFARIILQIIKDHNGSIKVDLGEMVQDRFFIEQDKDNDKILTLTVFEPQEVN